MQKPRQSTKHGKVDARRNRDVPVHTGRPVEHPRRNLQQAIQCAAGKAAAQNRCVILLDHFMDMDLLPSPGMPRIKKLTLHTGPMGVPSLSCTTGIVPTKRSAMRRQWRYGATVWSTPSPPGLWT
jgi:hypothetical protein